MSFSFSPFKTIDSRFCEGVTFTIANMTKRQRDKLRLESAGALAKLRELHAEAAYLQKKAEEANDDPLLMAEVDTKWDQAMSIDVTEMDAAYLRAGFMKVEGLQIEGPNQVTNAEDLMVLAPESLVMEIVSAIREASELSTLERKNLQSSTTSGAPVEDQTSATTAASASRPESTPPETVATA